MTKIHEETFEVVRKGVAKVAARHDLTDADGRAFFRQDIDRMFERTRVTALREYARDHGATVADNSSRFETTRALAQAVIDGGAAT